MVGATMLESDRALAVSVRSVLELLSAAYALNPMFGEAEVVEIGTGVRPAFLDNLPRLRWRQGVLHVNGFFPPRLSARAGARAPRGGRPFCTTDAFRR